jgi:hypothetical protein
MKVDFTTTKSIVVIQERKKNVDSITVLSVIDFLDQKIVRADTVEAGIIILWRDADYDAIGQWTDQDVITRIQEIYA